MKATSGAALRWAATILVFPIAGYLARLLGPVDSFFSGLLAGLIAGLVIGFGYSLALFGVRAVGTVTSNIITISSAVGMALGLAIGGALMRWGVRTSDLIFMGFASGLVLGAAQMGALNTKVQGAVRLWPVITALSWGLAWFVTVTIGVDVERRYAVFGLAGAAFVTLLTGLVAVPLVARRLR